jgi:cell division protein FtsB
MSTSNVTLTSQTPPAAERVRRLRPLWLAAGAFLLALGLVAGFERWRDLRVVERRATELEASIAATRGEIADLERRLARLAQDPEALERLAREELAMVYPEEVVVLLPEGADAPEPPSPATPPPPPPEAVPPAAAP